MLFRSVVSKHIEALKENSVDKNTSAIAALNELVKNLQTEVNDLKPQVQANEDKINEDRACMDDMETDIAVIQDLLAEVDRRIEAKETNIQLEIQRPGQ